MTKPKTSLGAKLHMGTAANALTALTGVISIDPPKMSRDTLPASDLDTVGGMEFIGDGLYDPGNLSFQIHYIAGDTTDDALVAAMLDGQERFFKIVAKSATATEDLPFAGIVISYGPDEFTIGGKQTATCSVKLSGDRSQAASA